jgi:branched-chain amino acid transport system permease protein
MNPNDFLQVSVSGLGTGTVYALIGMGFVITHRITGVVNFALGQTAVLGAMGAVVLADHVPFVVALALGTLIGAIAGLATYAGAIWPLRNEGVMTQGLVTIAVSTLMLAGLQLAFGTAPRQLKAFTGDGSLDLGVLTISHQRLWVIGLGVAATLVLMWFFHRTQLGVALTACAMNRFAAQVVGINVTRMAALSFALAGAVAALAVITQAPLSFVSFSAGLTLTLKGFIAAAIAGLDSIGLTLAGGIGLGLIEAWSTLFISSTYQNVIAMGLLMALLVLRPGGITKKVVFERV